MRAFRLLLSLAVLAFWVVPATAADLTKIDRRIAKEPRYPTGKPQYCLLVFGPEAKSRVWLVLAGNTLYVDRNGNGDLTEKGKQVTLGKATPFGDLSLADGKTKYSRFRLTQNGPELFLYVLIDGKQWTTTLSFAERSGDAPIIHFNGPLTLRLNDPDLTLARGEKGSALTISLGAAGLGNTFAAVKAVQVVPKGMPLVAEIEFPNRDPKGKEIKTRTAILPDT
jgi:hypothetical protein